MSSLSGCNVRVAAGTFSAEAVAGTLDVARRLADANITRITEEIYSPFKDEAHLRIPDDPDDWHTVALALVTRADIWTEDRHFFGCGVAVWRTPQLRAMLERAPPDACRIAAERLLSAPEVDRMHRILAERHWHSRRHAQTFNRAAYPTLVPGYAAG